MSIHAMNTVWRESKAGGTLLLLELAIADHARDNGWAWPGIESLGRKTRMEPRTVTRLLQKLEDMGELMIDRNSGPRGTNMYLLLLLTNGQITNPALETCGDKLSGVTNCQDDNLNPKCHPNHKEPSVIKKNGFKTEIQLRVEKLMKRRETTPFMVSEKKAFDKNMAALVATEEEDWLALEAFYAAPQDETYARKDLVTLVNNWNGEIDRAKRWRETPHSNKGRTTVSAPVKNGGVWQVKQRLEALKNRAKNHPANEASSAYAGEPTEEQYVDYEKLCADIRAGEREMEVAA